MSVRDMALERRAAMLERQQETENQLIHLWNGARDQALTQLSQVTSKIERARATGQQLSRNWIWQETRLKSILGQITSEINHFSLQAQALIQSGRRDAAQRGAQDGADLLESTKPEGVQWSFARVPFQTLEQLLNKRLNSGSTFDSLFQDWGDAAAYDAKRIIFQAMTLGWGPRETAAALAKALGGDSYARALTIARTEMLNTWRDAQIANFRANSDVVSGWVWSAAISPRTCDFCLSMNGTHHSLDEILASHPNCRCGMIPQTRPWSQILAA